MTILLSISFKFIFLFAPFFVVSMFLSLTRTDTRKTRQSIANRAVFAALCISLILLFLGLNYSKY